MKNRRLSRFFMGALLLVLPGCLYANVKFPLDINLDKTELGDKVGEASGYSVLALFAWGDYGTQAAAENGGITTINHADQRLHSVLAFVWVKRTTIVYGD